MHAQGAGSDWRALCDACLTLRFLLQVGLMGAVERYRQQGEGPPGYSPGVGKFESSIFQGLDNLYPGVPLSILQQEQHARTPASMQWKLANLHEYLFFPPQSGTTAGALLLGGHRVC